MGIINDAKSGATLTSPKPKLGWIVGAFVALMVLLGVIFLALKAWTFAPTNIPVVGDIAAPARTYMS